MNYSDANSYFDLGEPLPDMAGLEATDSFEQDESIKEQLLAYQKAWRIDLPDAAQRFLAAQRKMFQRFPEGYQDIERSVERVLKTLQRDAEQRTILKRVGGTINRRIVEEDARYNAWYTGPQDFDIFWPRLRERLIAKSDEDITSSVDESSGEVVAQLANPNVFGLRKKGLVLGFVQSGKTANYTAVISKALDRGYRLVIVLSGIHNNLRAQTQTRLNKDLGLGIDEEDVLLALTTDLKDFEDREDGQAILENNVPALAVVKKNKSRLIKLRSWLSGLSERTRERVPILIIDDEADQATPNNKAELDEVSTINGLLRDIWARVGTGTYIGYTATPFANVFMDPDEPKELFPSDFILSLDRPEAYFGAERVFGRSMPNDAENPDPGLDMVRVVPDEEAKELRPAGRADLRSNFDFDPPKSLQDAIRWFVIATSIRRARGQLRRHSSMLVHTTHYSEPHFIIQRRLRELLTFFAKEWRSGDESKFVESFESEWHRVQGICELAMPPWHEIRNHIADVLGESRVIVDNSSPQAERLDYTAVDDDGAEIPQTVIAVGGGTLSRGLTLEGLLVSYFVRTSNNYDTLLQMGRWFGYRNGYEDLPRIWTQEDLITDFQFLALVESELRAEIDGIHSARVTPEQVGVRVRTHPGRLEITARNRLCFAERVRLSLAGQRLQTFILSEAGEDLRRNHSAVKSLVSELKNSQTTAAKKLKGGGYLFEDVAPKQVTDFLREYSFHEAMKSMDSETMADWIRKSVPDVLWNVVFLGGPDPKRTIRGSTVDLGTADIGLPSELNTVNRAPLADPASKTANIKALMSSKDVLLDIDIPLPSDADETKFATFKAHRVAHSRNRGLLVVYPISKNSIPMGPVRSLKSRRKMEASEHLYGLGLFMPNVTGEASASEGDFVSVRPDWELESSDIVEFVSDDDAYDSSVN